MFTKVNGSLCLADGGYVGNQSPPGFSCFWLFGRLCKFVKSVSAIYTYFTTIIILEYIRVNPNVRVNSQECFLIQSSNHICPQATILCHSLPKPYGNTFVCYSFHLQCIFEKHSGFAIFNGLVSVKFLTGNHRFSHEIWGFPVNCPLLRYRFHEDDLSHIIIFPYFFHGPAGSPRHPWSYGRGGRMGFHMGLSEDVLKIGTMLCPTHCFFLGVKCETKQFTIKFGGLVLFITKFNGWLFEYYCLDAAICFILHGVELLVDFPPQPHDNFWYTVCKKACIYRFFIGKVYKPLQFDNTQSETLWTMFSCLVAHHD